MDIYEPFYPKYNNYDEDTLMRMDEIKQMLNDGLTPNERTELLMEELAELKINYNLHRQPTKICGSCDELKHACFFKIKNKNNKNCRYCLKKKHIIMEKNRLLRKDTKIHCEICDCYLTIYADYKFKAIIKQHNESKKHQRNLQNKMNSI
jgi:hypothetical protein